MKEEKLDVVGVRDNVLDYLEARFGLPRSLFEEYSFYMTTKERIYLGPKSVPNNVRIVTIGLMVARATGVIKPTTNLLQVFGRHVAKNIVTLDKVQALSFLKGEDVRLSEPADASEGYVLVKYLDYPLGCALLKANALKNQLPKAKRLDVKHI